MSGEEFFVKHGKSRELTESCLKSQHGNWEL